MIYLDTSALVKLVVNEPESSALRGYLGDNVERTWFTAALARTELVRAVARLGTPDAVEHARAILAGMDIVALTGRLLDAAAMLRPLELRTLDAIHLAAAQSAADQLDAVVTYDARMFDGAQQAELPVVAPAAELPR
ncbi:type II toxin-antitoxin system VapC family toxin [Mycobacterium sp.]|uniref:type II toxin-antitoxin system VapC family toxin n=1 Tax=Mycobacterium sp. TaxID=1785 RepID=UPI00126F2DE4|nr:type II toxin-antitoxin system VapC family toxin [Mycobacterium sp.]KAA8970398.1 MAG: type II toxin-antitoxin system VapC family toxin [Mycobacterium sp.]